MIDEETRRYTRYVVRDRDGEIVQYGRVYGLCKALELQLVGKDRSCVRVDFTPLGRILGPYILHPEVRGSGSFKIEIY